MRLCELVSRLYVRGGQLGGRRFCQPLDVLCYEVLLPWELLVPQVELEGFGRDPVARVCLQHVLWGHGRALLAVLLYHLEVPNRLQLIYVIVVALTSTIRIKSNLWLYELNVLGAVGAGVPQRSAGKVV